MIPAPLGRLAYRIAYVGLAAWSRLVRPHTRGVKIVVCDGAEILLVEHSYGPRGWDLPGGFARRGEAFEAAARRELAEELGAGAATAFEDIGELEQRRHGRHEQIHAFRSELPGRGIELRGFELRRAGWFDPAALPAPRAEVVDLVLALDSRFVGP